MAQHKRIVTSAYAGVGWRVPELLDRLRDAEDVFFDAVSLVDLPSWSKGRVALVGDAVKLAAAMLVPKTRLGLATRNLAARVRSPRSWGCLSDLSFASFLLGLLLAACDEVSVRAFAIDLANDRTLTFGDHRREGVRDANTTTGLGRTGDRGGR